MTLDTEISVLVNPFAERENCNPVSQRIIRSDKEKDPLVEKVCDLYQHCPQRADMMPPLTPSQIDSVLSELLNRYDTEEWYNNYTGVWLGQMIKMSNHTFGNRDFILNFYDSVIDEVVKYLRTKQEVRIQLLGNCGTACGKGSYHCAIDVCGNAGNDLGEDSRASNFIVRGDTGLFSGFASTQSRFTIYGNAGKYLASHADRSIFIVHGDIGNGMLGDAIGCRLYTPNKQTLEKAVAENAMSKNTLYLTDGKGKVLEEVK